MPQNPHQPHNWQSQNGADIICPPGTAIYAAFDGQIGDKFGVERGHENDGPESNHHGSRMTIEGAGNQAYYQHLDRFAEGIHPGATVHKGQLIGYSGTGGGIHHLHFALQHGDTDQLLHNAVVPDPEQALPDHGDHQSPAHPVPFLPTLLRVRRNMPRRMQPAR
jgi:murein DD-endopeptidase MepM/ murein hydrolase activator NlpD